ARAFSGSNVHFHALNSSGLISSWCGQQSNHLEFGVRPGISLYGMKQAISSLGIAGHSEVQGRWESIDLQPVMSLESRVVHVQQLQTGDAVSYGGHWASPGPGTVIVVPLGYA